MIPLETLIELSRKELLTEQEERILIMYFILWQTGMKINGNYSTKGGIFVGEIQTASIGSRELWNKNVEIAKNWFKTIEI